MKKWLTYAGSSNWLRVVGVATIVLLTAYLLVQQSTRLGANQAPLTSAQSASHLLNDGAKPSSVLPVSQTNLRQDSTVFLIITDQSHNVLASSAVLDGDKQITPPSGVFTNAKNHGNDHFTWQPDSGVRIATEVLPYNNGFVIAGQSLKEPEHQIDIYGWITLAAWIGVILWATFIPIPVRDQK